MKIPFSPPDISEVEINEVIDTLKSGWITTGPKTKLFEEKIAEYTNTSKAVCLNSATSAMEMTLRLLGIGEGDEVITSAYTYTSSASVIDHVGAKIVLVDTAKDSFQMDYEKLGQAITELSAWDKVEYKGWVPHTEVKKIYSRSIAGMAIHQSTQIMARGTLGVIKLFEFMEAKLPIICSDYPLWKDIVNQYNCGICVDPNDVEEIKSAINYIIENPEEAKKMGENGRKAVIEKYNWGTQEKVLLELYENL